MNNWMDIILRWGSPATQVVLLCLQIYAYRRTRHYSFATLVAASILGLLAATMIRVLNLELLAPHLRTGVFDGMIFMYVAYIVLGLWGAAALFRSYIRLTNASKVLTQTKAGPSLATSM
jgi:hypothetical protein